MSYSTIIIYIRNRKRKHICYNEIEIYNSSLYKAKYLSINLLVYFKVNTKLIMTFSTLYVIVKSELTNRMFSGFRSVWVSLFSCKTGMRKHQNQHIQTYFIYPETICVRLTLDSQAELVGHVSHLANGVGQVIVFFEEVESAES